MASLLLPKQPVLNDHTYNQGNISEIYFGMSETHQIINDNSSLFIFRNVK